jgi:hypothetical protein
MTKVFAVVSLLAAIAVVPARAETGGVVIVSRSQYMPGDDQNVAPAVMLQGRDLEFRNLDHLSFGSTHSITSDLPELFDSGVIQAGQTTVLPMGHVPSGTYGFHCSVHSDVMHGSLVII